MKTTFTLSHLALCTVLATAPFAAFAAGEGAASTGDGHHVNDTMDHSDAWKSQDAYWSKNYTSRPYYKKGTEYKVYQPAYKYGADTYSKNKGRSYDELNENDMRTNWEKMRDKTHMKWEQAKDAVRDAYEHSRTEDMSNEGVTNPSTTTNKR